LPEVLVAVAGLDQVAATQLDRAQMVHQTPVAAVAEQLAESVVVWALALVDRALLSSAALGK
jgi:hypothetical protein